MTDDATTTQSEPAPPREKAAHYRGDCRDMVGQTIEVDAGRFLRAMTATYDLEQDRTRVVFVAVRDPRGDGVQWWDKDLNPVDAPDGVTVQSEPVHKPLHHPEDVLAAMGAEIELIEASGVVTAANLDRLHQLGLPIRMWLINDLGFVHRDSLDKLVAAGQLDAHTFLQAIENNIDAPGGAR